MKISEMIEHLNEETNDSMPNSKIISTLNALGFEKKFCNKSSRGQYGNAEKDSNYCNQENPEAHNPYYGDDEESLEPIGVDNLEAQGTNGLVCIFSPLESDMVEDWNNDIKVQKFIEEKRLFLSEIKYDEWSIYGIEGDKEVKNYIIKNYSF
jgi:hypothetical protein